MAVRNRNGTGTRPWMTALPDGVERFLDVELGAELRDVHALLPVGLGCVRLHATSRRRPESNVRDQPGRLVRESQVAMQRAYGAAEKPVHAPGRNPGFSQRLW